jgi:hypothetical protein
MADRASNGPGTKYVLGHPGREIRRLIHQAALPKPRQKRIQTFPPGLGRVVAMSRITLATTLVGWLAVGALVAAPARQVFRGRIRDVRGIYGTLTLTVGEGRQARDRRFPIREARIVGPAGAEWKVGDLREGDRVEVEMAGDGRTAQEVRVLPTRGGAVRRPGTVGPRGHRP